MENTIHYTIKFYSFWATGSGKGEGYAGDSVILKDKDGLPIIPGKTLKGLFKDGMRDLYIDENKIKELLGAENDDKSTSEGKLTFSTARLIDSEELLKNKKLIPYLFDTKTATRLDDDKQTIEKSLRKDQVCIPLELEAKITLKEGEKLTKEEVNTLEDSMDAIKYIGEDRHRGLGNCLVKLKETK